MTNSYSTEEKNIKEIFEKSIPHMDVVIFENMISKVGNKTVTKSVPSRYMIWGGKFSTSMVLMPLAIVLIFIGGYGVNQYKNSTDNIVASLTNGVSQEQAVDISLSNIEEIEAALLTDYGLIND